MSCPCVVSDHDHPSRQATAELVDTQHQLLLGLRPALAVGEVSSKVAASAPDVCCAAGTAPGLWNKITFGGYIPDVNLNTGTDQPTMPRTSARRVPPTRIPPLNTPHYGLRS
jgi:hypothetical protein